MKKLKLLLEKIDNIAPNPWYIDGVEQGRPLTQIILVLCNIIIIMVIFVIFMME